ncbi:hypothetical protein D3C80_1846900 [compost metagenome]
MAPAPPSMALSGGTTPRTTSATLEPLLTPLIEVTEATRSGRKDAATREVGEPWLWPIRLTLPPLAPAQGTICRASSAPRCSLSLNAATLAT